MKFYIAIILLFVAAGRLVQQWIVSKEHRFLSEFELRRCGNSNRLSLVRKKTSRAPACTRKCCEYCPDEGDIHKRCAHPTEDDGWDDDWDEDKICDKYKWKWIIGYHLLGYTKGVHRARGIRES